MFAMFDELGDIGGPHYDRSLIGPGGRLTRFCKGGGNGAMLEESRLGREESKRQFETMFRFNSDQAALQQQRASEQVAATKAMTRFSPRGSETALDKARAGDDARRGALSRYGFKNTRLAA